MYAVKDQVYPMHSLYGALSGPYVPVRVTHGALVAHLSMRRLAAEPCSTAGLIFPSQCPCGTILHTLYSMVWYWRVSRATPMLFYCPKLLYPYHSLHLFLIVSLCSIGWYCGAGAFGLIGGISLSLSRALTISFKK